MESNTQSETPNPSIIEYASVPPAKFKLPGLRWWIISVIMLGTTLNYLARNTLSVAQVKLQDTLHINEKEYSWINNTFQGGVMLQPIVGLMLDYAGLRIGVALFVTAWGLINMAHGLAHSWKDIAGLRGLMGFAEGSGNPAAMKATAEWFPARERGLAGGIWNIGASFGSMLAPPLVGAAIYYFSWQAAFMFTGGLALIWVVLWLIIYRPPAQHPWLSNEERDYIAAGQERALGGDVKPSFLHIARQRNFWGIALPRFLADPMWVTLTVWLPLYMHNVRGWDLKHIAMFAWLPLLASDVGCVTGGTIAALLQKYKGLSVINARRTAFTCGAVLMTLVVFAGVVPNPFVAIGLFCIAGFAHQTLSVTVITMSSDLFRRSEVATVTGMAGFFSNAGVITFNFLIGYLATKIGYSPFFIALGTMDLIGATILWTVVRPPPQLKTPDGADISENTPTTP